MHLQDALQEFIIQLDANGRSPHTLSQYRRHVTALITWLANNEQPTDVSSLSPTVLARFFTSDSARQTKDGRAKKPTSLNAMRSSIRCFATYLHDAGLSNSNPARLLRRARCAPPPPRGLRPDEQRRLLDVLRDARGPVAERDRALIELLLGSGIRIGSAIALNVGDLDLEHREARLRSTKGDQPTAAQLPAWVAQRLAALLMGRRGGPVFRSGSRRLSIRQAQRRICQRLADAGVTGRSAHALRHTFAERIHLHAGDLRVAQMALGHASIATTAEYIGNDAHRAKLAVAMAQLLPVDLA